MRGIGKAGVILSTLVLLAGCRIHEEQTNAVIQNVTAAFLSPFVDAQRTTPLTQGTFKAVATVAPQKPGTVKMEKPQAVERRVVKTGHTVRSARRHFHSRRVAPVFSKLPECAT